MPDVIEVNCRTGETTKRAFTPEERKQREKDEAEAAERQKQEEAKAKKAEADLKAIKAKAKEDPAFAALARHMGVDV